MEPVGADPHPGRGRRRADRQHQRVTVLRGATARARDDARDACRRRGCATALPQQRRRPGRARLRRRVDAVRRRRAPRRPGAAVHRRADGRRRRRAAVVPTPCARPARPHPDRVAARGGGERAAAERGAAGARDRAGARSGARGARGARGRHPRLRAQERVLRRRDRPVGWHRLLARRLDRGRRARRGARDRRHDAVPLLERRQRQRCRAARAEPRDPHVHDPDRAGPRRVPVDARGAVRRDASRASPRRTSRPASAASS